MQQTSNDGSEDPGAGITSSMQKVQISGTGLSVLEEVIDRATSRSEIQREIDGEKHVLQTGSQLISHAVLSRTIDNPESALSPLRAFRQVQHDRLKKELFEHDKDARLRSGTRGMAARKALIAFEKKVAESEER